MNKLEKTNQLSIPKGRKNKLVTIAIVYVAVAIAITAIVYIISKNHLRKVITEDLYSRATEICELATLKCVYHDVLVYEKPADGLFDHGYKRFWMEYESTAEMGVDASQIQIAEPDHHDVVKVFVPEAKVLDVYADPNSMSDPISETGILTKITFEEKEQRLSEKMDELWADAEKDTKSLQRAEDNAKELLASYIVNVGKQYDKEYTIEWAEEPFLK